MVNTILQQPTSASLLTTDYLLGYQAAQSPPTRKIPVSQLALYYAPLTGATYSGAVDVASGGLTIGDTGIDITAGGIRLSGGLAIHSGLVLFIATTTTGVQTGSSVNPGWLLTNGTVGGQGFASIWSQSNADANAYWSKAAGANDSHWHSFYSAGSNVGSIAVSGATTLYNTTSDATMKIDDGMISSAESGRIIDRLRPRWFRWKSSPTEGKQPGFFAQEVHRVFSWAVMKGTKKHPWQMDATKLLPVVIAELQSVRARLKAAGL